MISRLKKHYNRQRVIRGAGNESSEVVTPTRLVDLKLSTPIYTAADVEKLLDQLVIIGRDGKIIIPDLDISGDYYAITMHSGRLTVEKTDKPDYLSDLPDD